MRSARFMLPFLSLFLNALAWGQQASTAAVQSSGTTPQQTTTSPTPSKDPQAVTVMNQVLTVAGGAMGIAAIMDYAATGTITYYLGENNVQGIVSVRGSGLGQIRLDSTLPTGNRSLTIDGDITVKGSDSIVTHLHGQTPLLPTRLVLPYLPFTPTINSSGYTVSYHGSIEIDGQPRLDIQIQRFSPGLIDPDGWFTRSLTVDFFVDPITFRVVMMQDVNMRRVRRVRYSDYRLASGLLVPFSIHEEIDGRPISTIQLQQIQFGVGLTDSDFQL
jgi:hypothetical protein